MSNKKEFLNLGKQPITNSFLTRKEFDNEYFYELSVVFDDETKLVSLKNKVEPETMFNETYAHRASMSKTMRDSFKKVADSLKSEFKPKKVLEIGSNDGVFIRNFNMDDVVAIEPCKNLSDLTNDMGYKTYPVFWDAEAADMIVKNHGKMDVIFSANTISHIENLSEVFKAVKMTLSDDGVFVFEDPSLYSVLNNTSYDQFYDEHVHIFSVTALDNILMKNGLKIFRVENLSVHGGSNRIYVSHLPVHTFFRFRPVEMSVSENLQKECDFGLNEFNTYQEFAKRVEKSKNDLVELLVKLKNDGKRIMSIGATYKSATIFNYCNIDSSLIEYITDTTPNKQGKYSPGMHIPIISPEEGFNESVDYAFLGAWNFSKEIMNNEQAYVNRGGKFITHVPEVKILEN